jgi:hypothetical protein
MLDLPVDPDSFPQYEVERIISHRGRSRRRDAPNTEYLVKWRNFSDEHNSWEFGGNLPDAVVARYWATAE